MSSDATYWRETKGERESQLITQLSTDRILLLRACKLALRIKSREESSAVLHAAIQSMEEAAQR